MRGFQRKLAIAGMILLSGVQAGCMTVGYSYAKDPKVIGNWEVTITKLEPQNIYNAAGVFWVGPFAKVESRGQRIGILDATGKSAEIVQPLSDRYELHVGEKARYIANRGQVWVQPLDYPLPPEFGIQPPVQAASPGHVSKLHLDAPDGWTSKPLTSQLTANGEVAWLTNVTLDSGTYLGAIDRHQITDLAMYAESRKAMLVANLRDGKSSAITSLEIRGRPALRFEASGISKTNSAPVSYLCTIIEGDEEVAFIRSWMLTPMFAKRQAQLAVLAERIEGL